MINLLLSASASLALAPPLRSAVPESCSEQTQPPAPDYAKTESWASRPGREGAASAVAPGATPAMRAAQVDVFYVHPTTYRSTTRWNQDVGDVATNGWTDASVIARQASVFNGCCRVFAPRYRQASSRIFSAAPDERDKAFDLAYGDVVRAFEHYLKNDNRGRPFILAGHSQGGFHIARLIEERIQGKPAMRRMVAAYAIGYNLSVGDFGKTYKTVSPCTKPAQTHCIVQWNAVLPAADLAAAASAGEQRYLKRYGDDPAKTLFCINPLTFDARRPTAAKSASMGAAPGAPGFGKVLPLSARAVSARCDKGFLIVEPDPALNLIPLPGGSMHYHDIGLFYADVRANAALRIKAFLKGI